MSEERPVAPRSARRVVALLAAVILTCVAGGIAAGFWWWHSTLGGILAEWGAVLGVAPATLGRLLPILSWAFSLVFAPLAWRMLVLTVRGRAATPAEIKAVAMAVGLALLGLAGPPAVGTTALWWRSGPAPAARPVPKPNPAGWFDGDGKPLYTYVREQSGRIAIYDRVAARGEDGAMTRPVTRAIRIEWDRQQKPRRN